MIVRRFDIGVIGVDHPPNENPIFPPPPCRSHRSSTSHPLARSPPVILPRLFLPPRRSSRILPPVFFLSNGAESFRSRRRITGNTISFASSTGARTRDLSIFHIQDFSPRSPPPLLPSLPPARAPSLALALDFSIFKYRERRNRAFLSYRSLVIPQIILPTSIFTSAQSKGDEETPTRLSHVIK